MTDGNYHLKIIAGQGNRLYLRDLWKYRELFLFLAWRDILVRYKQTIIGIAWSVIRPLLTMIVFTIVFGKLAKLPSEGTVPYVLLVFAGMLPWQFFSNTIGDGGNSLINNEHLVSKVYFPRIIIPSTCMMVSLIDLLISGVLLILLMGWYRWLPGWQIALLPAFVLLAAVIALGVTYWLAALNVKYRDFKYVVPFILQFGLYISPVGFSSGIVPEKWRMLYALNPMVGVIDGFRWTLFGQSSVFFLPEILLAAGIATVLLLSGFWVFRRMEREFADFI